MRLTQRRAGNTSRMAEELDEQVAARAAARNPEEERDGGAEDPVGQAQAILEDSEARTLDRDAAPGKFVERRTSEETTPPL